MAKENREIIAAVLAAGLIASGKENVQGIPGSDADMAVTLYQQCLEVLDHQAELEAN